MKIDTVNIEDVINMELEEDFETEFINEFCQVDTIVDLQNKTNGGILFMKIDTVNIEDVINMELEEDFETEFINEFCQVDTIVDLQKLPILSDTKIRKASDAVYFVKEILRKMTHECTFAIMLDGRLTPLGYCCVGIGTSTICPVSMSKIAQIALLTNATGIILVHNHPDVPKPALYFIGHENQKS